MPPLYSTPVRVRPCSKTRFSDRQLVAIVLLPNWPVTLFSPGTNLPAGDLLIPLLYYSGLNQCVNTDDYSHFGPWTTSPSAWTTFSTDGFPSQSCASWCLATPSTATTPSTPTTFVVKTWMYRLKKKNRYRERLPMCVVDNNRNIWGA
jgi:hypothetical protein